jgi:hypothetical protein
MIKNYIQLKSVVVGLSLIVATMGAQAEEIFVSN